MFITSPVIYAASSDARKATNDATSSGFPNRPIGISFFRSSMGRSFVMSDSMNPGAMAFTVILRGATSCARAFVAPINAAFAAL